MCWGKEIVEFVDCDFVGAVCPKILERVQDSIRFEIVLVDLAGDIGGDEVVFGVGEKEISARGIQPKLMNHLLIFNVHQNQVVSLSANCHHGFIFIHPKPLYIPHQIPSHKTGADSAHDLLLDVVDSQKLLLAAGKDLVPGIQESRLF